jgi:hypothetical protein
MLVTCCCAMAAEMSSSLPASMRGKNGRAVVRALRSGVKSAASKIATAAPIVSLLLQQMSFNEVILRGSASNNYSIMSSFNNIVNGVSIINLDNEM